MKPTASALCALLGGISFLLLSEAAALPPSKAKVTGVHRKVSLLRPRTPAVPARLGDNVVAPASVDTGEKSRSELTFPDTTLLRLGANTRFSFVRRKQGLQLTRGTALIKTSPGSKATGVVSGSITAAVGG